MDNNLNDINMRKTIEKVLKEKIGTSFVHEDQKEGLKVFKLTGYGRNIFIMYDVQASDRYFTKVIYPTKKMFDITIEQSNEKYIQYLIESIKLMIQFRKKEEPK